MITDLKDLLNSIGYDNLSDNGSFWRTNAIYRDGDNKTSLRINKRTGAFQDFVDKRYGTVEELIKLTLRIGDTDLKKFYQNQQVILEDIIQKDNRPKITMEKIWTDSELTNLLPHYKFYEDKGISKDVLKYLRSGFAHSGAMNQRYVFPIYNSDGKIHGWSGRDMTGKKDAKWKHMGRKAAWIYPFFLGPETAKAIRESREVILVESIGDMLALWERGYRNVLVTFGLVLSSKLASFIMSLDLDRIVIALNNDVTEDDINHGKLSAQAMFIDLMSYVDLDKIRIALPPCNDFGVISDEQFILWTEYKNEINKTILWEVLEMLRERYKSGQITPAEKKFGKQLRDFYDQA